ncbi:MAG TPA: DUF2066 domain-containing protein [Rudaea sp.]|nr:DUF2066 domain-containing protein [Rudaea sp.]
MPSRIVLHCLAVVLGVLALPLTVHAADLYSAQVPVTSQSDVDRAGALKSALSQVVVGLTGGDNAVLARPEVAKALGDAVKYVQQYQYNREVVTDAGQPQVRLTLIAQFDRNAVDKLLADLGLAHGAGAQTQTAQAAVDVKPQVYRVWISGVNSAIDYANAVGGLSRNNLVRSVMAERARGDGVELQIEITGPLQRLLDSLPGTGLRVLNANPPLEGVDALLGLQQ